MEGLRRLTLPPAVVPPGTLVDVAPVHGEHALHLISPPQPLLVLQSLVFGADAFLPLVHFLEVLELRADDERDI